MTRTVVRSPERVGGELDVVVLGVVMEGIVVEVVDVLEIVIRVVAGVVVGVVVVGGAVGVTEADAADTAPVATSFWALRRNM